MVEHPQSSDSLQQQPPAGGLNAAQRVAALQPKGSCWYCDQRVDSVRRFCSIACRNDYFEEEALTPIAGG